MPRIRALAPWLLALVALAWALSPYVSRDSLLRAAPYAAALLALLALVALALYLRRRPRRPAPPPPADPRRQLVARALRAARSTRPTSLWLCIGLPGHGKTTLLAAAGPRRTLTPDLELHLLDRTRELVLEHPGSELPLHLARPHQPLDAVLLALRLPDLLTADLTTVAAALRAQLAALPTLAVEVPLIVVCTHLDRLAGHSELTTGDPTPWSFELTSDADLPTQLRTWTAWVATQRLARIASEPSPELRARLHTFSAGFSRACDRLQALCELLLPTVPHAHLRAVHFTALHPATDAPNDTLLTDLATSLHLRLRPRELPTISATATPTAPLFAAVRRLAREATRTPQIERAAIRRRHLLAGTLALTAISIAVTARSAARDTHDRLQSLADLAATFPAPDPVPPLLNLRRELDLWPTTTTLQTPFTPPLRPTLVTTFVHQAHERLLRPLWRALEARLQADATHDELRAYLLLTTPEHVPNDMSQTPGPQDPEQQAWLLTQLPLVAQTTRSTTSSLPPVTPTAPPASPLPLIAPAETAALASPDLPLLLATFFAHATPADLRFPRDHDLVERTRARLRAQDDDDALVTAALAHASTTCEPLTLAAITHAERLLAARALPCSFTGDAWPRVHDRLIRAAEHRDAWVLGRPARESADLERLARLRGRYETLYIAAWTDFLAGLRVRRPADLDEAARLLAELTSDDRPLTRIFTALEQHTRGLSRPRPDNLTHLLQASDHPDRSAAILRAFTPLLNFAIAPPGRQSSLDRYHARLGELQLALDAARNDPAALPALQTTLSTALADTQALLQPPELRRFLPLLRALLLPPLEALQSTLRDHDKLALSQAYCLEIDAPLRSLVARYPFTRDARDELTLAEFTAFFHPTTGTLRRFRDTNLAPLLQIHGREISAKPTPRADPHPVSPAVLTLLGRAAELGELAFPAGELAQELDLDLHCNADIGRVSFTLDGATHSYTCGPDHHAHMRWPGATQTPGATLELQGRDGRRESIPGTGPWGLLRLLEKDGLVLPPTDRSQPRLVFRLDLTASRLGSLDLAVTPPRLHGATLLFGDPTRADPQFLAPLRDPALTTPPTSLFTGLPACRDLAPR